jgi:hypothetical protein
MPSKAADLAGTNLEQARNFNRRVMLETIRLAGPLSRADIARSTALSVQTVSNIADELVPPVIDFTAIL